MIEKKSLDKAKEDLVEASYYWEMFHSEVCWKGKLSIVTKMLGRLKSESAKIEASKENIRMCVIDWDGNNSQSLGLTKERSDQ